MVLASGLSESEAAATRIHEIVPSLCRQACMDEDVQCWVPQYYVDTFCTSEINALTKLPTKRGTCKAQCSVGWVMNARCTQQLEPIGNFSLRLVLGHASDL
jgi:hypothetical protein